MTSPFGRYNSYAQHSLDEKLRIWEHRLRNLETVSGASSGAHSSLLQLRVVAPVNFNSLSYVDFTDLKITYTKRSSLTRLRVAVNGSGVVNVQPTTVFIAADVLEPLPMYTGMDLGSFAFDAATSRRSWYQVRYIPDVVTDFTPAVPVGTYDIQVTVRVSGNQFTVDPDDLFTMEVSEVAP